MSVFLFILTLISFLLFVYLFYALFKPEAF